MARKYKDGTCKGYKVVRAQWSKAGDTLVSVWSGSFKPVIYAQFEETVRQYRHGPLALFETLDAAKRFTLSLPRCFQVWECLYVPSKSKGLWHPDDTQCVSAKTKFLPHYFGTVYADRIKLTKRLT